MDEESLEIGKLIADMKRCVENINTLFEWRDIVMVDMTKIQTRSALIGGAVASIPALIISLATIYLQFFVK